MLSSENDKYPKTNCQNPNISLFLQSEELFFSGQWHVDQVSPPSLYCFCKIAREYFGWSCQQQPWEQSLIFTSQDQPNFLYKNSVGSKDANICHMRGTANFIQYETLEISFSPTPQLQSLAAAHSFLCLSKLQCKNQTNPA